MAAFLPRSCPLCGNVGGAILLAPEAAEFCDANWTYDRAWRTMLGLPPHVEFPIRRCGSCALVYATLLPDDDFLRVLYERVIVKESCVEGSEHHPGYATRLRYVADLLQLARPGARALDFGSGAGVTLRILRACRIDAVGFEPSGTRAEYTRQSDSMVVTDHRSLQEQGPYGLLILDNVLEHVPDPVGTLRFIASISTTEAVAFVSVPSYEDDDVRREIQHHTRGERLSMTLNPWEHLNYFSLASLDRLLRFGGFAPIAQGDVPRPPDIGLRPEHSPVARLKNGAASLLRLGRWTMTGRAVESTERRYYRRT